MPKRFIKISDFKRKANLYSLPEGQTLSEGLRDKTKTFLKPIWFAEPEDLEFYKWDLAAEDRAKRFVFFRDSSYFFLEWVNKIVLEINTATMKGFFKVDRVEQFSIYYKVYLKKA